MSQELESFIKKHLRENPDGLLCPECERKRKDIVYNVDYGYVCKICDAAIKISEVRDG